MHQEGNVPLISKVNAVRLSLIFDKLMKQKLLHKQISYQRQTNTVSRRQADSGVKTFS